MTNFSTLIQLADDAYNDGVTIKRDGSKTINITKTIGTYIPLAAQGTIGADGFSARAHFSAVDNTLVITYTGTNGNDTTTNAGLANGSPYYLSQFEQAVAYAQTQIILAQAQFGDGFEIVFTGHSLGGALASYTQAVLETGSATVFNAASRTLELEAA